MGLNYHLHCYRCKKDSVNVELAIVKYIALKHPYEAELNLVEYLKFLFEHNGHNITLLDFYGRQSDPRKISGAYVIGLTDKTSDD